MNFGAGYDAWLERPYIERGQADADAEQAIEAYAEEHGIEEGDVDLDTALAWWEDKQADWAEDRAEEMRYAGPDDF